jgi:sterol 3beta-glucosyltransferase
MRIDILGIGSLGDVQPYVALGLGLQTAGYRVRMVTLGGFEDLVRRCGLDHLAIGESPLQIANTSAGRNWVRNRVSTVGFVRGFVRVADSLIERGIANYWNNCGDVEALIVSPMGLLVGGHIAERLRVPLIRAELAPPVLPTRYDWDGRKNLGTAVRGGLNAFIHAAFQFGIWSKLRRSTNAARWKLLGLPSLPLAEPFNAIGRKRLLLGAYSQSVVQRPPDWGNWIHVTGYWFLDDLHGWVPPGELVDFLGAGTRPVFIGFGSTPFPRPEATTELVVRAVARTGCRAVLVAGGSGLATGRLSHDILSVDSVPHGWLFSRVCAAVHHGGAGVTGAALRAGLPSVVVPVFADQPFWANRVFRLGAGPHPIPARRLTEDNLASAIQATSTTEMRQRAAAIGERIRGEDGIARALEILDEHLGASVLKARRHQHAR